MNHLLLATDYKWIYFCLLNIISRVFESNEIIESWWYHIELISKWSRNVNRNFLIPNSKCTMQKYGTCVSKLFHMWTINIIIMVHFNPDICHASKCASIMQNRFTEDIRSRVSITKSYMNDIYEFEFRDSAVFQCIQFGYLNKHLG